MFAFTVAVGSGFHYPQVVAADQFVDGLPIRIPGPLFQPFNGKLTTPLTSGCIGRRALR